MVTVQLTDRECEVISSALVYIGLDKHESDLYNKFYCHIAKNKNHKRVKITYCTNRLQLVKAINDITCMGIITCLNIVNNAIDGILLLNESSITPDDWEKIAQSQLLNIKWEYI